MAITVEQIKAGLAELGLKKGDVVLVHSDLRSLGKARDLVKLPNCGADLVIDAFLETIGPEGLAIFPVFTKTFDAGEPGPVGQVFDPAETPSRVGSISDVFRRRPEAVRSLQPTHSVSAIGRRAVEFAEAPEDQSTFDRRGPWGKMHDWDGYICWFGTDNRTNTTVHVVEDWMDLPYMAVAYALVKGADGKPQRVKVTKSPAGPRDFYRDNSKSARLLEASGILRRTRIGAATVTLMKVRDCHRVLREGIIRDPCLLLLDQDDPQGWTAEFRQKTIDHVRSRFGEPTG
jgi:aminoglycoside 3-N-acetyltransferase